MAVSDGTTSRNSHPEAASASHAASTVTMIAMRSTQHAPRSGYRRGAMRYAVGCSHRSTRWVTSKNTTLAATTKQIAP